MSETPETTAPAPVTFAAYGRDWVVRRKIPALLFSEMARTDTGTVESQALTADFFETLLGREEYRVFYRASLAEENEDVDLMQVVADAMTAVSNFPTTRS